MSEDMRDCGGKLPTFDGEMRNFPNWWIKFTAYATMAKIKDILGEDRDPNLPEKEGMSWMKKMKVTNWYVSPSEKTN